MGIFSRMGDIINSNLNAMVDKAENPEKIARLIISEMEDTLIEVRTNAARSIAEKKELARKAESYDARAAEWGAKAELALEKGREDLARGAVQAKQQATQMAAVVRSEIEVLDETVTKADADLGKLQSKLNEAKAKHKSLIARGQTAETRIRVRSQITDTKVDDALARYERMERKVDELEAHVEAFDLGQGQSLEAQFAEIEADEAVEAELAALKASMKKPVKKAANKLECRPPFNKKTRERKMDEDVLALFIPIIAIVMGIGFAMLKTYLKHKEKMMDHMSGDQVAELDRMDRVADILDQRVNVLERILDDEVPNWREKNDKTI